MNDLNVVNNLDLLSGLRNTETAFYCSITDDGSRASKARIANLVMNAGEELKLHANEVLSITDVAAYPVDVVDELGESATLLRVILVDVEGKTYFATSKGVYNSLIKIFGIFGLPDNGAWHDEPLQLRVKLVKSRTTPGNITTLEVVG